MKTKLLKKIRKKYSILYYPKGVPYYDFSEDKEKLADKKYKLNVGNIHGSKESAIEEMLRVLRRDYYKYTSKYKREQSGNKPVKIWWLK